MRAIATVSVFLAAISAGSALAQDGGAKLMVQKSEKSGEYLTDAAGRSVYLFEADTQGKGDTKAMSACKDDCLAAWPPFLTEGTTQASEGISADFIGMIEREDGTTQVTYNGWPLYYYVKDENPGDVEGHDIEDFGAEWYLLTPEGEKAHD